MKKINELTQEEQKRIALYGTIVVIGVFITGIITFFGLASGYLTNAMKSGMSIFAALRAILPLIYIVNCFPAAILCEFAESKTKKRQFRLKNVFIFLLLFGEGIFIIATWFTLFDFLLPQTTFLIQFPLVTGSFSAALLIVVATFEKTRIKKYLKKTFE